MGRNIRKARQGLLTAHSKEESRKWRKARCSWCGHHPQVHDSRGCIRCDEQGAESDFRLKCLYVLVDGALVVAPDEVDAGE